MAEAIQVTNEELGKSIKKSLPKGKKNKVKGGGGGTSDSPFNFLKETNAWLESVPGRITAAYENAMGDGTSASQEKVDAMCAWLAWKVNVAIERKRQTIIKILYGQFEDTVLGKAMKAATVIQSFFSNPLGTLGSFASMIFGPVPPVLKWMGELTSEVMKLGSNLANIASVVPPPPPPATPQINYNKFKLVINPISLGQIMAGPAGLAPPEVMFPEPEKPFSENTFAKAFEESSAKLKSSQKKYILMEEDKKTLEEMSASNSPVYEAIQAETKVADELMTNG